MHATEWKTHQIRRKDHVPSRVRTDSKDDTAAFIQTEIVEEGRWPMDLQDIAEAADCSRQHVKNTLDGYFEVVEHHGSQQLATARSEQATRNIRLDIAIPEDIENRDEFLRGYIQGWTRRGKE